MAKGKNRAPRPTAKGSQRRPSHRAPLFVLQFGEVDENGRDIFPFDVWLRKACDYYLQAPEVIVPELDADGQPVLDSWSRPRETAPDQHILGSKPGAVWMTRRMFQYAWENTFWQPYDEDAEKREAARQQARKERIEKRHAAREIELLNAARTGQEISFAELIHKDPKVAIRYDKDGVPYHRSTDNNHPMDTQFRKLVKRGDLMYFGARRYMLSEEMLYHLNRVKVWSTHLDRGARWEGLRYEETFDEDGKRTLRPLFAFAGNKSPRQRKWKKVILPKLEQYLIFDVHTIRTLADEEGLLDDTTNPERLISERLARWKEKGQVEQVAPRLFRATRPFTPDHQFFVPRIPHMSDWFWAFALHWSKEQIDDPDAFFDANKILLDLHSTPEWVDDHLADGLERTTILDRFRNYRNRRLINHIGRGRYQLSEDLLDIFRPLHQSPVNVKSAAVEVIDFFTAQSGLRERWWFRRGDIAVHFPEYAHRASQIISTLEKSGLIEFYRNYDEGNRAEVPDTLWLPTEKAGKRLGFETEYWLVPEELDLDQNDRPVRKPVKKREAK